MEPPTGDSDLTFALGIICFGYYIYQGFASNGVWYLKSFLGPYLPLAVLMLPIELADNLFRPFRWAFVFTPTCSPITPC